MDRGAWQASPWVHKESDMTEQLTLSQYFCLRNSWDRGAWQATVHGVAKESDTA